MAVKLVGCVYYCSRVFLLLIREKVKLMQQFSEDTDARRNIYDRESKECKIRWTQNHRVSKNIQKELNLNKYISKDSV